MIWVKVNGIWMQSTPFIKNQWRQARPYVKNSDTWDTGDLGVTVFPNPDPTNYSLSSTKFSVNVFDGSSYQNAHVYSSMEKAWNSFYVVSGLWPSGASPTLHYLTFTTRKSTTAKISKIGTSVTSIDIGPYRKNKNYNTQISNGVAYVPIDKGDKLWITINNEVSSPLFLFADAPMPTYAQVTATYPGYTHIRYASGVSAVSAGTGTSESAIGFPHRTKLNSSSIVYLEPGAYVKGHFNISACNEVKFFGQGILTQSGLYNWWTTWVNAEYSHKANIVTFFNGSPSVTNSYLQSYFSGVELSGLTVINTQFYFNGPNPTFNSIGNLKFISPWFYSTDGPRFFNFVGTSGARFVDSFVFNCDDVVFPSDFQKIGNSICSGCYFATNNNGIFTTYFPTYTFDYAYSAIYSDIDIRSYAAWELPGLGSSAVGAIWKLLSDWNATSIDPGNDGTINVTFSGIRIENRMQAPLFVIGNIPYPFQSEWQSGFGKLLGMTSGIYFKDIEASSLPGNTLLSANLVSGYNATNKVTDVTFTNVKINGTYVTDLNYTNYFRILGATNKTTDRIVFNTT